MKGNVFDIKRFAIHDGPGIRTTVFFAGCPLKCWWCHNPECMVENNTKAATSDKNAFYRVSENGNKTYSIDELFNEIEKDVIFFDESHGGVTFSGGEPLMQVEFLNDILKKCRVNSISTTIDTCGYVPFDSFGKVLENTSLFLYDLKLFNEEDHIKYTGVSNKLIFENLKKLNEMNINLIIRIPLIPNITDTNENLNAIGNFVLNETIFKKIDILPYNKLAEDKYRRLNKKSKLGKLKTQSDKELNRMKNIIEAFGLEVNLKG